MENHLEEQLSLRPGSPLFARLAGEYLAAGRAENAAGVCATGLQNFPDYASAHLILARCHAAQGNYLPAVDSLYRAMALLPDSPSLRGLLAKWQEIFSRPLPEVPPDVDGTQAQASPFAVWEADGRIVSKTLAEIYAMQGAFDEAIITYRLLRRKRPLQNGEIDKRISELEVKLQARMNQQVG